MPKTELCQGRESLRLLDEYRKYQVSRNFSAETRVQYRASIARYVAWLGDVPILEATHHELRGYLAYLSDEHGIGPHTVNIYLGRIKSFYQWAIEVDLLDHNPAAKIRGPKFRRPGPKPMTEANLEKALINAPDSRMYLWLLLGAYAGFRCAEMANLEAEWIHHLDDPDQTTLISVIGKGNKERTVPVGVEIEEALRAYGVPESGPLFVSTWGDRTGQPLSPATVGVQIGKYFAELGIETRAHSLRHRFATMLYNSQHDLLLTQQMLGHSSPVTTQMYCQVSDDAVLSVLDAVRPRTGRRGARAGSLLRTRRRPKTRS